MRRFNNRLFLFLFLFICVNNIVAQEKEIGIIVELSSGKKVEYRLKNQPKLIFDGKNIELTSGGVKVDYTLSEFVRLTIGEVEKVNTTIGEDKSLRYKIRQEAGYICFSGFDKSDVISVFSMSGIHITSFYIEANGVRVIPIYSLPIGISVIKTCKQTIKVTRR